MAGVTENGVADVWARVQAWPAAQRIALATRILQSLEREQPRPAEPAAPPKARKTVADLWGAWATDQPPPTDEDVKRIIDEEIMRKYG
jgi:hypothetical protein